MSRFNFPNNTRIKSTLADHPMLTYKVIGNEVADQLTALNHIYLYDSGFLGCENTTPPPPPTYYYGLERCSDGVQTFRTGKDVSSISLAITQKVEDASNVEYIVLNNNNSSRWYNSNKCWKCYSNNTNYFRMWYTTSNSILL